MWRINSSRVQWRWEWQASAGGAGRWQKVEPEKGEDNWVWSPQGLVNMHVPEMWGFMRFENAYAPPQDAGPDAVAQWPARKALMCVHWLMPDFRAGHGGRLPESVLELGVKLGEGAESGVRAVEDLPGG